jgi:mono/diheme cytochrome c family protein
VPRCHAAKPRHAATPLLLIGVLAALTWECSTAADEPSHAAVGDTARNEFFEQKIRPLFVRHCYECHSGASNEIKGSLRLDYRDAIMKGGDSGPAVAVGNPNDSLLLSAIRHQGLEMPPGKKLTDAEIQNVEEWIRAGAFDPRDLPPDPGAIATETFEALYQDRRQWWSLQPPVATEPPPMKWPQAADDNPGTEIDRFILAKLHDRELVPAPRADERTLIRRACFALTGLPPSEEQLDVFLNDQEPRSWQRIVDQLLASPHFGERWSRHWMDVVRYTDTYGYEWDMPAKGAWRYRDYLIRAFNTDVGFDQLVREQIAGDLLKSPRVNHELGINESLIGPMFYQMGEKRHGDSSEFNGIHQEMLDNKIDAFGKAFLATTISCARCHDHKLDAVSQRDYYALGGLFMNARWVTNTVDLPERNKSIREELKQLKQQLRTELAERWQADLETLTSESLTNLSKSVAGRPLEDPLRIWSELQSADVAGQGLATTWQTLQKTYRDESQRRISENSGHFATVVDFRDGVPKEWSTDGEGTREISPRGDFVVALSGEKAVDSILFGGLCTNSLSPRMNGALRTPWTKSLGPGHLSFEVAGGDFSAQRTVVDNAFLTEKQQYLANPTPQWRLVDTLSSLDRNVYIEFATKTSNPNFPPRVGLGGACSEEQVADPRSWFQISRVVKHTAPFSPYDELTRLLPLLDGETPQSLNEAVHRFRAVLKQSVAAWQAEHATDDHVRMLNWMLSVSMLQNSAESPAAESSIARLIRSYRALEQKLAEPMTVNGMADIDQPLDYRLNVRGDYDQLGDPVPHGAARFLLDVCDATESQRTRLELAELVASPKNPLTARVYVNRVWHWLFGQGLVRTPDDFGHVGDLPSHPELLDHLTHQFIASGWSTKQLVRNILLSQTWQQSQQSVAGAQDVDPTDRLLHHFPVQRLDAESLRDAMLLVSGRLDSRLYGPTSNPYRLSEDDQKRLFSGPLDGLGRRSIYTKVTIMEPPRFLATFNQPAPKIPTGRRDVTTTPAQSLTLLNDPFVAGQADYWASQLIQRNDTTIESRVQHMFLKAVGRQATSEELSRWSEAARDFAIEEKTLEQEALRSQSVWQAMAHAMFNTKEFLYVR